MSGWIPRETAVSRPGARAHEAPWTNVYGLARTLLALGTLSTLASNDPDVLFRPLGTGLEEAAELVPLVRLSLFSVLAGGRLGLARVVAVFSLLLVASGWRPRLTGILHWWVSFSFAASCVVVDGGDQVTAVLALLLLPVTLTDPRPWHWSPAPAGRAGAGRDAGRGGPPESGAGARRASAGGGVAAAIARSALAVARLQVAVIYLTAAVSKLGVAEWRNGTAVYYWFLHPVFGVSGWRRDLLEPLLGDPLAVTALTWGAVGFEMLLAMALVMEPARRGALLVPGLLFHSAIAAVHGLFSFSLAMCAALVLYLRPAGRALGWPGIQRPADGTAGARGRGEPLPTGEVEPWDSVACGATRTEGI